MPGSASSLAELDATRPAVIVKFDENPLHHGTLGAVRSLGRAGVPVHLVQESHALPVARSRYVRSVHAWPAALTSADDAVAVLTALAAGMSGRPVLMPVDDAGAIFLSENANALAGTYDFPQQPPGLARSLIDKHSLVQNCAAAGVPHPPTIRPHSWDELVAAEPPGDRWPVVLKRIAPWIAPSVPSLPSTLLADSRASLIRLAGLATTDDPGLLLQQYLPHSPDGDWFFHGYYDAGGTVRFSGTGVKRRSWPAYTGLTVLGRSASNTRVHAQVDALLCTVSYAGIVDVDVRLDQITGQYHVLDVNPRMGAQHRLFQSATGVDVVRALHMDLTGRSIPPAPAVEGRTFLAENFEPAAARRYLRDGRMDFATWWRSVRSVDEFAWLAGDDPMPFAAMVLRSAGEGFRHRYPALRRNRGWPPSFAARVAGNEVPARRRTDPQQRPAC